MCDICVMNAVKEKMLSRRSFFQGYCCGQRGSCCRNQHHCSCSYGGWNWAGGGYDPLSSQRLPTYFGESQFSMEQKFNFAEHKFNLFQLTVNEHTGTHIDAPLHFSADGKSVDEIPVENLIAPLCVIDIASRAESNADAQVTPDDLKAWIAKHGAIPKNACVAMHSGWGAKVDSDKFRGFDGKAQHYPGFHLEATKMLLEESGAMSLAVDTLSLDHGISADFATHYAWLPTGRFGIENLANLDKVPASGATLVVGAPKHKGGTGGPARIFAMV